MRNLIPTSALLVVLAFGSISRAQEGIELAPADPHLAPQEFTVDDGPVSVQVPFQLLVNGRTGMVTPSAGTSMVALLCGSGFRDEGCTCCR
jgi:hypothetical protein